MDSLSIREKILIGCLVTFITIYLYYSLFLNCYLKRLKIARGKVEQYTISVEKIKNTKKAIKIQREDLEKLKAILNKYLDSLPDMERNPEIAYNLKKLGDITNVNILSLSFGEVFEVKGDKNISYPNTEGYVKIFTVPISISVTGEYEDITNFIHSIENDKRIIEIKGLGINADSKSEGLNLSLSMNCYYTNKITDRTLNYDFNSESCGKNNPFK